MTFYETITAAVNDILEHGFDSGKRVEMWVERIRQAALQQMVPNQILENELRGAMQAIYTRLVERGDALQIMPGIPKFTIDRVKPRLRAELDRRISVSAALIKSNKETAVNETLQRFVGWASSIPPGGSDAQDRNKVKVTAKKALASLPFDQRRVIIDQSHKLTSTINDIIAKDGGAIAGEWRSMWRQRGYNYRVDHKERDRKIYLIRGSWAHEKGLVKPGPAGFMDEITQPGEEVVCRCGFRYLAHLRSLPPDMLTKKGIDELERVKALISAM